jgi:hypothetical protein
MKSNVVVYEFSSKTVATCNLDAFLKVYTCHKLPVGADPRALMGRMMFSRGRYHDERREPYVVPEVGFVSPSARCGPTGSYLKGMTFSCLSSVAAVQVEGQSNAALTYDRRQLDAFLHAELPYFEEMCQRVGLWHRAAARRVDAIFAYFQLRFRPTVNL